jgi:hypothetical protein
MGNFCPPVIICITVLVGNVGKCSGEHIQAALSVISHCKPREVVIQLPWPNNTDIQQVRTVISNHAALCPNP